MIADAGEITEDPGQRIIALEGDHPREVIVLRIRLRCLEERDGEKIDVFVGLDVNVGLSVVRVVVKIQIQTRNGGGPDGRQCEGNHDNTTADPACRFPGQRPANKVKRPEDRDDAPRGFVGDDRIGKEGSARSDRDVTEAGIPGNREKRSAHMPRVRSRRAIPSAP